MNRPKIFAVAISLILLMLPLSTITLPQPTLAQSYQGMSCNDLWFARNQIFATNGYCFKSRRAQAAFGTRCFPPYGRLSRGEQSRVDRIKRQENRLGCRSPNQATNPPNTPSNSIYANMGCSALWYERNAIYARNGHCFKSTRGRQTFGAGCFPPYGKIGGADQRQVNQIQRWESRNNCR